MATSRGKQFEDEIRAQAKTDFDVHRIADNTAGYAGGSVCDFILYSYPHQHYLECKSTKEGTLNFGNITETQWHGLLEKHEVYGVSAGYLIWFITHDETWWVSAKFAEYLKNSGAKSISLKTLQALQQSNPNVLHNKFFKVQGAKKRVFFTYDMAKFKSELEQFINYGKGA